MNNDIPDNTVDDVRAAIAAMETKNEGTPAPAATAPASVPDGGKSGTASAPAASTPGRSADGRFQAASPAAPEARDGAPAPAATPVAAPAPGGQPAPSGAAGDPAATPAGDPAATPATAGPTLDPSKPPSSWRPEMREKWATIPEDVRQEIVRREEAGAKGIAQLQAQHAPAIDLYKDVTHHAKYFEHIKKDPRTYFGEVIALEQTLTLGNPAQKFETLLNLGDQYGVPLRNLLEQAMGGPGSLAGILQQSHAHFKTPATLPPAVTAELNRYRQAEAERQEAADKAEFDAWIGDGTAHPHFDKVGEEMIKLIEAGVATDYQDAYDRAVWARPDLRPTAAPPMNDPVAQRQAAAAAVTTPAPAPIVAAQPQNETEESTEDAVRKAWAQHASAGRV